MLKGPDPPRPAELVCWRTSTRSGPDEGSAQFQRGAGPVAVLSAASGAPIVAPGSIVSLYGTNLNSTLAQAPGVPLPNSLSGVQVTFRDSAGTQLPALIYLVSPNQINAVVPHVAPGYASIVVTSFRLPEAIGNVSVSAAAPALFSANSTGAGVAAATLVTAESSGATSSQLVFTCGSTPGSCVATPLDLSDPSKKYYLVLYGTGLGGAPTTALVGGAPATVTFAGSQSEYPGLDQINLQLSSSLAGRGSLDLTIASGNQVSNRVSIFVK